MNTAEPNGNGSWRTQKGKRRQPTSIIFYFQQTITNPTLVLLRPVVMNLNSLAKHSKAQRTPTIPQIVIHAQKHRHTHTYRVAQGLNFQPYFSTILITISDLWLMSNTKSCRMFCFLGEHTERAKELGCAAHEKKNKTRRHDIFIFFFSPIS